MKQMANDGRGVSQEYYPGEVTLSGLGGVGEEAGFYRDKQRPPLTRSASYYGLRTPANASANTNTVSAATWDQANRQQATPSLLASTPTPAPGTAPSSAPAAPTASSPALLRPGA
ncbi:hypothetical protein WMY93_010082 [Mugilogobius chulae]|uniref:Uncharacterized protein n=1 Tax=Mugilogobius chulae TaxID=88201 RepID=A0AAW0PIP3_9GOBI